MRRKARTPRQLHSAQLSRFRRSRLFIGLVWIVWLAASISAGTPAAESVHYEITPQLETGGVHVELIWNTQGRTLSAVHIAPRWGTVSDVPALIRDLQFGGDVSGVRPKGARWLLQHPRGGLVTCTYAIDPRRRKLDWEGPHYPVTTPTFFHGMGNAFLITPQGGGGLPEHYSVTLRWNLPAGWKATCSWGNGAHIGARMAPEDLRNSVYLAGQIVIRTKQHDGHTVTVALRDRFGFDADEFAELAATIVAHECRFMNETDFPPFLVTAVPIGQSINPGESKLIGMGLYRSFALMAAPGSTLTDGFEHLFAHELFHYWNGRLLRARNPDKLVYWFLEGFTDYYALRILYESGYWKPQVYCKWINRHLREYHNNPAIHASNEDILARYWSERETVGEVAYQRGLLLGLRWHWLAREHGIRDGIDRLFKTLVERGRRGQLLLSNPMIQKTGIELLGDWFEPELKRFVRQAETVDVPLEALAPELIGQYQQVYEYQLGFDADYAVHEKRIRNLVHGSAAQRAGLREDDRLISAKVHSDPDREIELRIRRDGKLKSIRYYPRGKPTYVLQFTPSKERKTKRP